MQPDISVITVTYNSELVIPKFLTSLDRIVHTLRLFVETILTDNASQDGTRRILNDAPQKFPGLNMSILVNKNNVGLAKR